MPRYLTLPTCCKGHLAGTLQEGEGALRGRIWDLLLFTFSLEKTAKVFKMDKAADRDVSESRKNNIVIRVQSRLF